MAAAPPRATDLIANVRTRDEVLRKEAEQLARLREAARTAAEQEATAIVAGARTDIRRIIENARAALLALKSQLEGLEGIDQARPQVDAAIDALEGDIARDNLAALLVHEGQLPESIRQVQNELQSLFEAGQIGRDGVTPRPSAAAESGEAPVHVAASTARPGLDPARTPATSERNPVGILDESIDPGPAKARGRRLLITFGVMAAIAVAALIAWWSFAGRPAAARRDVVAIPPVPQVAPAADADIPTLTASLIALPPSEQPASDVRSAAPAAGALALDLDVRRPVWVRAIVDEGAETTQTLAPGTTHLVAARSISLATSDAGAVAVSVNGAAATALGRDGEAVTRRFATGNANEPPK